ncbi:B12-binding domain-containing radical SAM protein [Methanomicrobium antiquum]|uniref:B12-binding domain-containing radical SAM protein n=1 Tax=Methanomicrobium antiquum TaxID=487686 RepID=A0AAF0FRX9_9EURY|nr:radical SAM protein [Methanomicrobium antiquum]WFN36786.1 B12-binding domain-containing radical SAM protein [Methanomicrobium antiquum]
MKNKKKIVFVSPPNLTYGTVSPPVGLLYLGTVTKESGRDTVIIDAASLNYSMEETIKLIINEKPDYVGVTAVTITVEESGKIAKAVKDALPDTITIIGGHHLTALPEETMTKYPQFDFGIIGEGEITTVSLLNAIDSKKNYEDVDGIIYYDNGQLITTSPRERIKDLDSLPIPDWSLLPNLINIYSPPPHVVDVFPSIGFNSSRGCPGKCIFCSNSVFKNKMSSLSGNRLYEIVSQLKNEYGIKEIWFGEDNFLIFKKRLLEFCKLVIDNDLQMSFVCSGRIDNVKSKDDLLLMKKAGFRQIWYGIESGDQRILNILQKGITVEEVHKVVNWTDEAGIDPCGYFIFGAPGENEETLSKTLNLALDLKLRAAHTSFMIPFPGSKFYENFRQYGVYNENVLDMYKPSFIPFDLNEEILVKYFKRFYRDFYFRPRIIWIYVKRLKNPHNFMKLFRGFIELVKNIK